MSNFTNDLHKHKLILQALLYNLANQLKERADNHDNSKLDPKEKEGCFEKHINRMRKYYTEKKKKFLKVLIILKEKILIHMKNIIIVQNLLFKRH